WLCRVLFCSQKSQCRDAGPAKQPWPSKEQPWFVPDTSWFALRRFEVREWISRRSGGRPGLHGSRSRRLRHPQFALRLELGRDRSGSHLDSQWLVSSNGVSSLRPALDPLVSAQPARDKNVDLEYLSPDRWRIDRHPLRLPGRHQLASLFF